MKRPDQSYVFTKMHVNGNDFLVLNGLVREYFLVPEMIRNMGDRTTGVGFDQLVLLQHPRDSCADVLIQFYNADGTIAEQCGNGCAAAVAFLHKHKLHLDTKLQIETSSRITKCSVISSDTKNCYTIDVDLGLPRLQPKEVPFLCERQRDIYELKIPSQDTPLHLSIFSLGNPHAVIVVPNVDLAPLDTVGPQIQQHDAFPNSTNVEVLEIQDDTNCNLRIFERGVGETRACGTGAAAALIAGRLRGLLSHTVYVKMPGGTVRVQWEGTGNPVILRCDPKFVYTGTLTLSEFT